MFIEKSLQQAGKTVTQLDAIALSSGPGSYSSLRIGASVAKGLCYALDIPLIAIETLRALALAATRVQLVTGGLYVPMIDARRMEVYSATFDEENKACTEATAIVLDDQSFNEFFEDDRQLVFCGNGSQKARQVITHPNAVFTDIKTSAKHLIELAYENYKSEHFEDLAYFTPFYLKPPNITTPRKKAF